MTEPEPLHFLWPHINSREPVFTHEEVSGWPAGVREALTSSGLLCQSSTASFVECDACAERHSEKVVMLSSRPDEPPRAFIPCPENGRVRVPLERLNQWAIDLNRLTEHLSKAFNCQDEVSELQPRTTWYLGRAIQGSRTASLFLLRRPPGKDAFEAIQACRKHASPLSSLILLTDSVHSVQSLAPKDVQLFPLRDAVALRAGLVKATESITEWLLASVGKGRSERSMKPIEVPLGMEAKDIPIVVTELELKARVADEWHKRDFIEAGFEDLAKGNKPNALWTLMRAFAQNKAGLPAGYSLEGETRLSKQLVSKLENSLHRILSVKGRFFRSRKGQFQPTFRLSTEDFPLLGLPFHDDWSELYITESKNGDIRFMIYCLPHYESNLADLSLTDNMDVATEELSRGFGSGFQEYSKTLTLEIMGMIGAEGTPTAVGAALLAVLRGEGKVMRPTQDDAMLELTEFLVESLGADTCPFQFSRSEKIWSALFNASSEKNR